MKAEDFQKGASGRVIPIGGHPTLTHAFLPDPLPPTWEWPGVMWPLLMEAREAVARLDGTARHLTNSGLLLRPLQNREALKSSSLEGTVTEPTQQALFALDPQVPTSQDDPANAFREVYNYAEALRFGRNVSRDGAVSLWLIRSLHEVLMCGVRGSDRHPGEFRRTQNQIGRPARFVPPPTTHLAEVLGDLERYVQGPRRFDPLVDAFVVHYQFETIHPVGDGNGRVGRLLLAILIEEWLALSDQWLYLSAYFDRNKDDYIDLMYRVSTEGAWTDWISFCLTGVVEEARDTLRRCERLIALHRDFHDRLRVAGGSVRLVALVDSLFESPVITVTAARDRLGVQYPTARSDLKRLEEVGIVAVLGSTPQIAYYCPAIFEVTYSD